MTVKSVIFTNTQWKVINDIIIIKYFDRSIIKHLKIFCKEIPTVRCKRIWTSESKVYEFDSCPENSEFFRVFPEFARVAIGPHEVVREHLNKQSKVEGSTPEKKSDFSEGYSAIFYWLWNNVQRQLLMANLWHLTLGFKKWQYLCKGAKHKIDVVGQKLHR